MQPRMLQYCSKPRHQPEEASQSSRQFQQKLFSRMYVVYEATGESIHGRMGTVNCTIHWGGRKKQRVHE